MTGAYRVASLKQQSIQPSQREVLEETAARRSAKLVGASAPAVVSCVILFYLAKAIKGDLIAGDDASDVGAFQLDKLPKNICFELHRQMIARYFSENGSF
jgi:hypothetical protein